MKKIIVKLAGCVLGLVLSLGCTELVQAATQTKGQFTYSTDGTATKIEDVSANDFLNFDCVTAYASGRTTTEKFSAFLQNSSSYYTIPGLRTTNVLGVTCDSMVPQSICEMGNYVIIGAYDYDNVSNSVLYVMSSSGTLMTTIVMPNKSHMGALAYDGTTLWVGDTTSNTMIGFTMWHIQGAIYYTNASGAKSVQISTDTCDVISLKTNPSFANYYDGVLWVGLFTKKESEGTPYIYGYTLNYSNGDFISAPVKYRIEAPIKSQGMTFYKNSATNNLYLAISQSYDRNEQSKIIVYKPTNYSSPTYSSGYYQIYKGNRTKDITMPNMSQGICWDSATMLLLFESAAKSYSDASVTDNIADIIIDCYCRMNINKVCTY